MTCTDAPSLTSTGAILVCVVEGGVDWRVYITPALVLLSLCIAFLALRNTRAVARQKATLDLIEKRESTEHYRDLSQHFSDLRRGIGFDHLTSPAPDDKASRKKLLDFLNHYELIAIGIEENILDARIYRRWMEGAFIRDWNAVSGWVQRERWKQAGGGRWEYRASVYANYQKIACRWSKEAVRLDRDAKGPPTEASGPGDEPLPHGTQDQ